MKIQLEDGRTLEVEGNPAPEELDGIVQSLSAPKDDYQPKITNPVSAPAGLSDYTTGGNLAGTLGIKNKQINEENDYERSFIGDEQRQALKKLEEERPFISGVVEGLGNTLKNFDAGTSLSPDFLPEGLQKILDYQPFGENLPREERQKKIDKEMAELNERYQITRHENPVSTMVGETIPYIGTGLAGEKGLIRLGNAMKAPLKRANIGMNKALGNLDEVARIKNKPDDLVSEYTQSLNTIARGAATGAAEGAAEYDKTALEGAGTAALGGMSGMFGPLRVLNKVRNERDVAGKKIIDQMNREGFQITPGIRTGNKALQTEEAGVRNSDYYAQEFANQVDRPNQRRMTDMAGEAIGLNTKNRDLLSQEELSGHMKGLKDQYSTLERNTTGQYGPAQMKEAAKVLKELKPTKFRNTTSDDKRRFNIVRGYLKQMRGEIGSIRTPKGMRQGFNGTQYQGIRQQIQDDISQAYNAGDNRLATHLKKVQNVLDDSLTAGMDKATSKQWKDLNERYAMTNMLMEGGLTPSGKVDPSKLTSAVMSNTEAGRTLTGKGGRVKKFQDIARYNDVLTGSDVSGGSLTGLGSAEPSANRSLMKRAYQYATRPIDLFSLSYKLNTNKLPFIGRKLSPAHGISPTTSIQLQRAINQTETPQEYVGDQYDELMRAIKGQ
jgi:hypothetical protein